MFLNMIRKSVFWFFFIAQLFISTVYSAELYIGSLPGWTVQDKKSAIIPVFVRYDGSEFQICIWKEEANKRIYCEPYGYTKLGSMFFFGCSWMEKENGCFSVPVGEGFLNVFLNIEELPSSLHFCVKDAHGQVCSYYGEIAESPTVYPWVFVGMQGNDVISVNSGSNDLYVPVFLKASGWGGKFIIWTDTTDGRKYCKPSFVSSMGVLYISCNWISQPERAYISLSPHLVGYANVVLHILAKEAQTMKSLYAEFDTSIGSVISKVDFVTESEENEEAISNETESSGNLADHNNSADTSTNPLLQLLNRPTNGNNSDATVWDGTVADDEDSNSEQQDISQEPSQVCSPTDMRINPNEVFVSIGEKRSIAVRFVDNCGEEMCINDFHMDSDISWIDVVKRDCYLLFKINAPEEPEVAEVKFTVSSDNFTDKSFVLTINVLASGGVGTELEEGKYYFFNFSPHEVKNAYFYACVSQEDPVRLLVEESSYYHYGAIEVIVKFIGDSPPSSEDYPSWEDYYKIASYLFYNIDIPRGDWVAKQINLCPQDYYEAYSEWYGAENPEYSQYFYCMGLSLTRTLWLTAPPGERKCGWWAVTLFNNLDEERADVRVWFR